RYYEEGLIYRGARIVNWCPRCRTAISDLEVKHAEVDGKWWFVRYPFLGDEQHSVTVATTRPETMLGDVAVAVNPGDGRYQGLVGRRLILPLVGREIPIIADEAVLADFGTGAVKVTPAHDAADFEIGQRHGLARIKVIDETGHMTDQVPARYQGLTREACRELVVSDLAEGGYLVKTEPYTLSTSRCERCGTVVEPLESEQWFLRMPELAQPAIEAVKQGQVEFIPERWTKVYLDWLHSVRDWCISRQLWWGHRIPVFYCDECGSVSAEREDITLCPRCRSSSLRQDEDILDTWFSSALWPFSTMGWPDKTQDLARFYPTSFLSTAPDIIFLWVARMIFSGLKFMGQVPVARVYFHSFLLTGSGERMSRSKGVGIGPVLMFEKYGTDAVRFTLTYLESQSQSYRLYEQRFELGRNFTNKIWNAARLLEPFFSQSRLASSLAMGTDTESWASKVLDRWILARYAQTVRTVTQALESCSYSLGASQLYDFFWHDLCDWYLEFVKPRLRAQDPDCIATLVQVMRGVLRLLHPIMPFITEELWQRLGFGSEPAKGSEPRSIMDSTWPVPLSVDESGIGEVKTLCSVISGIRNIRSELRVPVQAKVACLIKTPNKGLETFLVEHAQLIREQARVSEVRPASGRPERSSSLVLPDLEVYLPLGDSVDLAQERGRLARECERLDAELARIATRLADEQFLAKAPAEVVDRERRRRLEIESRRTRLAQVLESL
ncbi:MAG: valine--tRNA ligase, partial [candidate division WOR-3 bacterium]